MYNLDTGTGLLMEARQLPSSNFNERPSGAAINLVVVHSISVPETAFGTGVIDDLFLNHFDPERYPFLQEAKGERVSAHFLIDRVGKITQYVPTLERAWHAGKSHFQGQDNCNDFSIGIELEAGDNIPFTMVQYANLAKMIATLITNYPAITQDRVVGHSDVAPGRKVDPGPLFDWARLQRLIEMELQ